MSLCDQCYLCKAGRLTRLRYCGPLIFARQKRANIAARPLKSYYRSPRCQHTKGRAHKPPRSIMNSRGTTTPQALGLVISGSATADAKPRLLRCEILNEHGGHICCAFLDEQNRWRNIKTIQSPILHKAVKIGEIVELLFHPLTSKARRSSSNPVKVAQKEGERRLFFLEVLPHRSSGP